MDDRIQRIASAGDPPSSGEIDQPIHSASSLRALLERPLEVRVREHQYRFAQSIVFGLPVVALQLWGRALGGEESGRWVGGMQALLAGWIMYVGAAGMVFEGCIELTRRRITGDFLAGCAACSLYVWSVKAWIMPPVEQGGASGMMFHLVVLIVMVWTGWRWTRMRRARPRIDRAS